MIAMQQEMAPNSNPVALDHGWGTIPLADEAIGTRVVVELEEHGGKGTHAGLTVLAYGVVFTLRDIPV